MNNFRLKIGIKEIVCVVVLFVLIRMIPPEASDLGALVFTIGVVVGAVLYYRKATDKKKEFPAVFVNPDSEQEALVAEYYEPIREQLEKRNTKPMVFVWVFLGAVLLCMIWKIVFGAVPYLFILITTMLAFFCPVEIWLKFCYAKQELAKIEKICSDCEIARVEYSGAGHNECRWYIRGSAEYYYVDVRCNGETMKLKISSHAYNDMQYKQEGCGYLIKNLSGKGVYDVYDFMPEYGNKRFAGRKYY